MLNVVLFRPEIPPNTGNLIRLCANSGAALHLIEPLGFSMEAKALRRAGLDYRESARVRRWASLEACWEALGPNRRTFAATTRARAPHTAPRYRDGDILLFGPESCGLPDAVLDDARVTARLRVPMRPGSRSLNLSNAVSIVLYEAWRQLDFAGAEPPAGASRTADGSGARSRPSEEGKATAASRAPARSDAPSARAGRTARRS